jgi:DnaJ-class molecular chaperone
MRKEFDPQLDYYAVLQVHLTATKAVIRSAFRVIVKELQAHPDLGGDHEQAVLINDAYRVLSDPALREEYDRARSCLNAAGAKSPSTGPASFRYVYCPACGRRNRLAVGLASGKAVCGACKAKLGGAGERKPPSKASGDNHLSLSHTLYQELLSKGEVELRVEKLPRGGKIICRRCRRVWTAQVRGPVHRACPACGASDWNALRLFKCRLCGQEFTSQSLHRDPYLLHASCPACLKPHWHAGREGGLFSGLFRFIKG